MTDKISALSALTDSEGRQTALALQDNAGNLVEVPGTHAHD